MTHHLSRATSHVTTSGPLQRDHVSTAAPGTISSSGWGAGEAGAASSSSRVQGVLAILQLGQLRLNPPGLGSKCSKRVERLSDF